MILLAGQRHWSRQVRKVVAHFPEPLLERFLPRDINALEKLARRSQQGLFAANIDIDDVQIEPNGSRGRLNEREGRSRGQLAQAMEFTAQACLRLA